MGRASNRPGPGRPPAPRVSKERILTEALALLEERGVEGVTMRALAGRLRVDPMAPYHYFPDKDAILRAAAAQAYSELRPAVDRGSWRTRLRSLARTYLRLLARSGQLLRYVSLHRAASALPSKAFDAHFREAVRPLRLSPRHSAAAVGAFVDFLHGYSLALRPGRRGLGAELSTALDAELDVVLAGIASLRGRRGDA